MRNDFSKIHPCLSPNAYSKKIALDILISYAPTLSVGQSIEDKKLLQESFELHLNPD
jgi:hypothetical protein